MTTVDSNEMTRAEGDSPGPRYDRPKVSMVFEGVPPYGLDLFVGGKDGAIDELVLRANNITTVVNCAVNLDLDYLTDTSRRKKGEFRAGPGALRYYKLGLVDDAGNPETMMLAGYYLLKGAFTQVMPARDSYPNRKAGHVLLCCRGGRSRSVAMAALFLHASLPQHFRRLEDALLHVRTCRQLRPDEWFETPKPVLVEAARRAARWIRLVDDDIAAAGGAAKMALSGQLHGR